MDNQEDKYSDLDTHKLSCDEKSLHMIGREILCGNESFREVEIYKCPKCGKIFLAADVLWKDIGNDVWEPYCVECKVQLKMIK